MEDNKTLIERLFPFNKTDFLRQFYLIFNFSRILFHVKFIPFREIFSKCSRIINEYKSYKVPGDINGAQVALSAGLISTFNNQILYIYIYKFYFNKLFFHRTINIESKRIFTTRGNESEIFTNLIETIFPIVYSIYEEM